MARTHQPNPDHAKITRWQAELAGVQADISALYRESHKHSRDDFDTLLATLTSNRAALEGMIRFEELAVTVGDRRYCALLTPYGNETHVSDGGSARCACGAPGQRYAGGNLDRPITCKDCWEAAPIPSDALGRGERSDVPELRQEPQRTKIQIQTEAAQKAIAKAEKSIARLTGLIAKKQERHAKVFGWQRSSLEYDIRNSTADIERARHEIARQQAKLAKLGSS